MAISQIPQKPTKFRKSLWYIHISERQQGHWYAAEGSFLSRSVWLLNCWIHSDCQSADGRQMRGRKCINIFSSRKSGKKNQLQVLKPRLFEPEGAEVLILAPSTCSSAFALMSARLTGEAGVRWGGVLSSRMKLRWAECPWMKWHVAIHRTWHKGKYRTTKRGVYLNR